MTFNLKFETLVYKTRPKITLILVGMGLFLSGCAGLADGFAAFRNFFTVPKIEVNAAAEYGVETDVQGTIEFVKTAGDVSVISSRAIRLPSNPLRAITAFHYEFPGDCGGHQFRVYEADGTQILEYAYDSGNGDVDLIRDYISGPSPFIQAGLWSAYDHTRDSIVNMSLKFERRGDGILKGTYSQGPVTGLNSMDKRALGLAYDRALRDSHFCRS